MAPAKDKWVRRFIIPETTRHKKGFTIYKITSMVFLKPSHEEISKVSVWKRYNDFKNLHSELAVLHSQSQIKESYPKFPKSKFFNRFETEVIQERREWALKFLNFIGRHSNLYSSDIFIKFFETSHMDSGHDCSQSLSSDTSEDDRHALMNPMIASNPCKDSISEQSSKHIQETRKEHFVSMSTDQLSSTSSQKCSVLKETIENDCSMSKTTTLHTNTLTDRNTTTDRNCKRVNNEEENIQGINTENNNHEKEEKHNMINKTHSGSPRIEHPSNQDEIAEGPKFTKSVHDGSDLPQSWPDSSQYILIAAAHMSAAFRHEAMAEYEEAFTQYKMGISNLLSGVQSDTDAIRAKVIKDKIAKYLERAEKLYNRHLNCNISLLNKPVSELQYYKVLKIMRSVMLVKDLRQNCLRIVKAVEKSCGNKESINKYICRGQVPYMVRLHACMETETTVFLILEYLSRGKLWDFITTEYKSQNDGINHTNKLEETCDITLDNNSGVLRENGLREAIECIDIPIVKPEFGSTSFRVQNSVPQNVEQAIEVYNTETSTIQLLEKAQMLLESVTATLKESNTVATRLHESEKLLAHQDTTALLNLKNSTCQETKWSIILNDETPEESHSISKIDSEQLKLPVKDVSCSEDVKSDRSPDVTDSSSLTDSYTDLSLSEKDTSTYAFENSKSISMHLLPVERTSTVKTSSISDLSKSLKADCSIRENNYLLSDEQIQYFDTGLLMEYTLNNNVDVEEELWIIPENLIRLWAAEILMALEALHQQDVIVFDLEPDNILFDDNGHVQLTYITPARHMDLTKHKQPYASPELCMFLPMVPLTPATDIWSFGVILYELITGNKFQARHPGSFHSHSIVNIPSKVCENAKSLLLNLLKYDPSERLTIAEIKRHPYFQETDWSTVVSLET